MLAKLAAFIEPKRGLVGLKSQESFVMPFFLYLFLMIYGILYI